MRMVQGEILFTNKHKISISISRKNGTGSWFLFFFYFYRPKKEKKTRIPKMHNQVVNADEECAKMEEQCKQQWKKNPTI